MIKSSQNKSGQKILLTGFLNGLFFFPSLTDRNEAKDKSEISDGDDKGKNNVFQNEDKVRKCSHRFCHNDYKKQ
ncbi:MAG: hypothetical protein M1505_00900 [Patescibacteria group bacterium]|nr:hypothetical protein [Patescibacteria group bacterium]MCL5257778.1 hypothetical protein [Patescibacteria group bacterium]